MGKLAVKKYFSFMYLIITVLVMIMTFIGLYGGNVNPVGNNARAMICFALPLLIAANIIILIFWLIKRRPWALVPALTLLCCVKYIGAWYQISGGSDNSNGKRIITVATYNVASFGREASSAIAEDILHVMEDEKVDVLLLQEYSEMSGDKKNSDIYNKYFKYNASGNGDMIIFSRYPIESSKNLVFEETNNSALWADININGKKIKIFNVHMQTTGINRTLHGAAKTMKNGYDVSRSKILMAIYGNYMLGMDIRAGQAIQVANEQRMSDTPCILGGDFNDVPYSYVYNMLKGNLSDGFREGGKGYAGTFRGGKKNVRIDYIFNDKSMNSIKYYTKALTYSDHVPVFSKIEIN